MDFSIITRAGISQADFAELLGVSRVTVNHCINKPGYKLTTENATKAEGILHILERLLELEKLPRAIAPKDKAAKALLMAQLHKVVQKHLDPKPANA